MQEPDRKPGRRDGDPRAADVRHRAPPRRGLSHRLVARVAASAGREHRRLGHIRRGRRRRTGSRSPVAAGRRSGQPPGPDGPDRRPASPTLLDPTTIAVGVAALIALQTHVKFERTKDGKIHFKIEKKAPAARADAQAADVLQPEISTRPRVPCPVPRWSSRFIVFSAPPSLSPGSSEWRKLEPKAR
jgi:hypothetical protein